MIKGILHEWRGSRLAAVLALCLATPLAARAGLSDRDAININISNDIEYTITGDGSSTIATLAGDMPDNAWQNTPAGNAVVSGDARNGRVTGVIAYDASSKAATTLTDVMFTWAVEGSGVLNYGNMDIADNPTFHKAWLARLSKQAETSSILVQSIPYRRYDVIVYCSGADETAFGAINVNGVSYVGDTTLETETKTKKADSASDTWGGRSAEPILGQNAIRVNGLENPELSLVIASGATSICAVQILRDMGYGIGPTTQKTISINLQSGKHSHGTTPAMYGLEPVPDEAWTRDGLSIGDSDANYDYDVEVAILQWDGADTTVLDGVTLHEKAKNAYKWSGYTYTPQNQILSGYVDDSTPAEITVSGIPYDSYDVIVYCATDTNDRQFGPVTVNDVPYRWDDAVQEVVESESSSSLESTRWGVSRSRLPAYGRNALRIQNQTASTLTIVGANNGNSARGGIAAIQIVQNGISEDDLFIKLDGDLEYEVTESKTLAGTVYVTGSGTLTLSGTETITAAKIALARDVILIANADRLDATSFTGKGTVVYDGAAPVAEKGWTESAWKGTVWIKNQTISQFEGNQYGNAGSTIRFTGVTGFLQTNTYGSKGYVHTVPIELVDDGDTVAFTYNNGWSGNLIKINTLKGTGTLKTQGSAAGEHIYIADGSGFTGVFNLTGKYVYVGGSAPESTPSTNPNGKLDIRSGVTLTVPSGKTWTANGGFVIDGTVNVDGTLASAHSSKAVSGSGTVVFTGRVPTPTSDAWWKNSDWTGTVQVNGYTSMAGDIPFNNCGNAGSIVALKDVTGWINANYTCTPKLKITGTLYLNNGSSGKNNAFKVGTLLGDGTISGDGSAPTVVFNVTTDWSGFTGTIGLNNKCVVFGSTIPDSLTAGTIYVSSGAVVTPQQASGTWWAVGGIEVDGELRAPNLDKFGGGTTITTSDTGVFTLTDSNNTQDQAVDYARITGTGTLRYADVSGKWRTLSTVNYPTNMICENNLSAGIILTTQGENTIGSLAGTGTMRSDWSGTKNVGDRSLKILQAKDTEYSGLFHSDDRITTVTVAPGTSTAGTLTLSGAQTVSNDLVVESGAKVNLTGTWKGAMTVAGTIGGTGTLDGDLTFESGATFKAGDTSLTVTEEIAAPDSGVVTVDVSQLTSDEDEIVILKSENGIVNGTRFELDDENVPDKYEDYVLKEQYATLVFKKSSGGDEPVPSEDEVYFYVVKVEHTTITATDENGAVLTYVKDESGSAKYIATGGADVTVVYSAVDGYVISGVTTYVKEQVSDYTALSGDDITNMPVKSVDDPDLDDKVAIVTSLEGMNTLYETLNAAFEAVQSNETVTLIRDAVLTNNVTVSFPVIVAGAVDGCNMGGPLTLDTGSSLTLLAGVVITNELEDAIVVTDHLVTIKYPTALGEDAPKVVPPEGYDAETTDNGDGTSTISFKVHEDPPDPPPPTPTGGGYEDWQQEHGVTGEWDEETGGVPNVFRYVFDKPEGELQLITNITFNAGSHAVIWTPQPVNDLDDPSEFSVTVVASDDFTFDEGDRSVPLSSDGATEIDEDLLTARFFWLKVEKAAKTEE